MDARSCENSKGLPIGSVPGKFVIAIISSFVFLFPVFSAQELIQVEWKDGRLSVTADGTHLSRILQEVARQTGLEIRGLEGLQEEDVSVRFSSLPLREGLKKLLAYVNYVVLEKRSPQGDTRPTLVWVSRRRIQARASTDERPKEEPVVEEDQGRRLSALYTSAQEGDQEALQKAFFDPDEVLRATAFELLSKRDRQKAIVVLLEATKSDRPETRLQALQLLHQSSQANDAITLSALDRALGDQDTRVKGYAVQVLAERGTSEAMGYLRRALHDPDPSVRMMVVEIVAQNEQGRQMLRTALRDDNEAVRSLAAFWLKQASSEGR